MTATFRVLFYILHVTYNPINSGAVQLDSLNINAILAGHEFVFINFYADWCRFSIMLAPIWDESADKISKEFGGEKVIVGKVDCDKHKSLGARFHITKYPTLKYVRNGQVAKREYRGKRSLVAFLDFVREQIKDPVNEFKDLKDLNEIDGKKRHLIGYFENKNTSEYANFRKSAMNLKDDCMFHAGFGETVEQMHPPGQPNVAFRPKKDSAVEEDEFFRGNIHFRSR